MDSTSTDRDAVISAANVLMVALLKMNRVIIPVLLKYTRARRMQWIQNAEYDVLDVVREEERNDLEAQGETLLPIPKMRRARQKLISGVDINVRGAEWQSEATPLRSAKAMYREVDTAASSSIDPESGLAPDKPDDAADDAGAATRRSSTGGALPIADPPEHDPKATLRQRIDKEHQRRRSHIQPFVYTSVVSTTFTIFTILFYSLIIITIVLALFPFGTAQAIVFAFSLIATATISEAETLLRKSKTTKTNETDLSNSRPRITDSGTDPKASTGASATHAPVAAAPAPAPAPIVFDNFQAQGLPPPIPSPGPLGGSGSGDGDGEDQSGPGVGTFGAGTGWGAPPSFYQAAPAASPGAQAAYYPASAAPAASPGAPVAYYQPAAVHAPAAAAAAPPSASVEHFSDVE